VGVCVEFDVEQRDFVVASVALAGGDQFVTFVFGGDR